MNKLTVLFSRKCVCLFVVLAALSACSTVRRVPVSQTDSVRRDSVVVRYQTDTVRETVRDSVIILQRADTVFVTRWRTLLRDRVSLKTDTVTVYRDQTATRIEQVTVREDTAPRWHCFTGWWFGITAALLVISAALWVWWRVHTRNW